MSRWWAVRLVWLALGLVLGVVGVMPETAGVFTGILALVHIAALFVLLGRLLVLEVEIEGPERGEAKPTWTAPLFGLAGMNVSATLRADEDKPDPRETTLIWDSALFLAAVAACGALFAVAA